jgi:two-component system, cell cycle sensor histidine kinase and response regulator CckA
LMVILNISDMLLGKLEPDDQMRRQVEMIKQAAEQSAGITHQLLAFSRKQVVSPQIINLNDALLHLQKMLGRLIGEDVTLGIQPGKDLGYIKIDPVQVEQVVINLAVNARDAMPDGGRLVIETHNVRLDEESNVGHPSLPPGEYVRLAVSDSGTGIDKETLPHIFEPFFTTKARGKGTGLGLATVYGIVKQAGGDINIYSETGIGTTFKIYFPRFDRDKLDSGGAATGKEVAPGGVENILVVEDNETVREVTVNILKSKGYNVFAAGDGEQALYLAENLTRNLDMLVTDVVMTGMTGRELAQKMAALKPQVKILFVSGYTDDVIAQHGVLEKDVNFLQKPFSATALLKKVRAILDRT